MGPNGYGDADITLWEPELLDPRETVTRNLVVLLLDASGSMAKIPEGRDTSGIAELNLALTTFLREGIHKIPALELNGEVAIAQFSGTTVEWLNLNGHAKAEHPFYFARQLTECPQLTASGNTPMGAAITAALVAIRNRKAGLEAEGLTHEFRPNVFLLTDGRPSDDLAEPVRLLRAAEAASEVLFFALGTGEANDAVMRTVARPAAYYPIKDQPLHAYIDFVSKSMEHQRGRANESTDDVYQRLFDNLQQTSAADKWLQS